jgi:hypothetical protein
MITSIEIGKLLAIVIVISIMACSSVPQEFYVSPDGNDQNPGTQSLPFASIEKAKRTVVEIITRDHPDDITIWLESGIHKISEPIVFDSDAFSNAKTNIYLKNTGEEPAIISGGIRLKGWQKSNDDLWFTQLPEAAGDLAKVREVFINGERAPRARFPNQGYLRVKEVGGDKRTLFYFEPDAFPIPKLIESTELILLHDWSITRIPIREIDQEHHILEARDSIGAKVLDFFTLDHWEKQPRYFLENDAAFIDLDKEWYYNAEKHRIYIRIADTMDMEKLHIEIPRSKGLVQIQGMETQPVKNIHFKGISFNCSAWDIPEFGYGGIQATYHDPRPNIGKGWSVVPAAVHASYADGCSFEECSFQNLGGSGLWMGEGCINNRITQCTFRNISGNGIMIGEGRDRISKGDAWWKTSPELVAKNNTISDCLIRHCGEQYFGAVGIWAGLTERTTIENCHIHDLPYTGISIGWMWNPSLTPARGNIITGNHIHDIMQTLSDGGGIYMLGLQPGSEISNNLIHDVKLNVGRAESNGMFLDEGITDVIVSDNIIYNIAKSPIRFHKATTNLVTKNRLFCKDGVPAFAYNNTDSTLITKVDNQIFQMSDNDYNTNLKKAIQAWNQRNDRNDNDNTNDNINGKIQNQ